MGGDPANAFMGRRMAVGKSATLTEPGRGSGFLKGVHPGSCFVPWPHSAGIAPPADLGPADLSRHLGLAFAIAHVAASLPQG